LICAARYSLNRVVNSGPLTCLILTSVESGRADPRHCARRIDRRSPPGPELTLGLDIHLPDATVLVEVIHEGPAEKRLECLVHRVERDPLLEDLFAVDLGEVLRHARQQGREERRELGSLPGGGQKFVCVLGEERGVLAGAILQDEGHTTGGADARNRRR
jgi:hypothetical protein